jgi:hypothetical protein
MTRTEGGDPRGGTPTTTGTGASGEFAGRVAGDDADFGPSGTQARSGTAEPGSEEGNPNGRS